MTGGRLGPEPLLFALAVTALTALACGLGPAVQARHVGVSGALREGGRGGIGSRQRLRGWLVVAEVAAAMLILSGAALLARSYVSLQEVDPGFMAAHVLTARVSRLGVEAQKTQVAFGNEVLTRLRALPGVTAAAATSFLPLDGMPGIASTFLLADRPVPPAGERPTADFRPVTPGYFATLRIPVRQGRDFTASDLADRPGVAIVNEAFVRAVVGRRVRSSAGASTTRLANRRRLSAWSAT